MLPIFFFIYLGFSFLHWCWGGCNIYCKVAMPCLLSFSFLPCQVQKSSSSYGCNALSLGLFISTRQFCSNNLIYVAMPCLLGFSFLRYPSETSVKSILSSIIFASNSQNILNFIIFLSVFGFPFFY